MKKQVLAVAVIAVVTSSSAMALRPPQTATTRQPTPAGSVIDVIQSRQAGDRRLGDEEWRDAAKEQEKREKKRVKELRKQRREQEKAIRKAERERRNDLRKAASEREKDSRKAARERAKGRR